MPSKKRFQHQFKLAGLGAWLLSVFVLVLAGCTPTPTPPATSTPAPTATSLPPTATPLPATVTSLPPTATSEPPAQRFTPTPTTLSATETPINRYPSISPDNATQLDLIYTNSQTLAQALAWLPNSASLALANQSGVQRFTLSNNQEATVIQGAFLPTTLSASTTTGLTAIARQDNSISLLDPADGSLIANLQGHTGAITSITFSADGRYMASAATDNTVRIWDASNGVFLAGWQLPYWVVNLAFSPDGDRLAGVDLQAFTIHIWEIDRLSLDTPAPLDRPLGDPPAETTLMWTEESIPALYEVVFSPDWSQVAWVARGTVQLMQVSSGELGPTFQHEDYVNGIAWSPDGKLLASAAAAMVDNQFTPATLLWDPQAGKLVNTLILPDAASGVAFSPDGKLLAVLGAQGEVQLWAAPR